MLSIISAEAVVNEISLTSPPPLPLPHSAWFSTAKWETALLWGYILQMPAAAAYGFLIQHDLIVYAWERFTVV